MSYIGKKPSFSQVRTAELAVQRGTDITTSGTIAALDVSNISLVRLTAASVLQGIAAPSSPVNNGKRITIINANSSDLIVKNESSSASASDRIVTGVSREMRVSSGASITLVYNTASSRWSVESSSAEVNIDRLKVASEVVSSGPDISVLNSGEVKSTLLELTSGFGSDVRSIAAGLSGQFVVLVNKTGSIVQVANEDSGAGASDRILTGTGGPISLQNNASLFLAYLTDSSAESRWNVVGGTGSGGGATEQVTQTGIGNLANFPVGTPLYVDASAGWTLADASAANTAEVAGMIGRSLGADLAEVVMAGEVSGVVASVFTENALPARGKVVFLSTTAGKLTITEPSVVGEVSKPVGIVHSVGASSVDIMFFNMRGSVIGAANARTQISLQNNATVTVQSVSGYEAGELAGYVVITATTPVRFYVQAQFAKNGAGSDYNLSFQTTGDTPPAGFNVSITAGGNIQVTLPNITGFSAAQINFALNAPAIGTSFPLSIDSSSINIVESAPLSNRNLLINGNFDIWQRGTSQTTSGYGSDDRWVNENGTSTKTHSQQAFDLGQTEVPGNPKYFSRTVVSSVAGANSFVVKTQRIESVTTLAGQTVTVSFWAKADAPKNIAVDFGQWFGTGGTPSPFAGGVGVTTFALTTSWKKYTVTADIPSVAGKTLGTNNDDRFQFGFWFDAGSNFDNRTNSLGNQSGTFDIAQVQLEAGSKATAFERRPYGMELQLCQRYYEKTYDVDVAPGTTAAYGPASCIAQFNGGATTRSFVVNAGRFTVKKRATPGTFKTFSVSTGAENSINGYSSAINYSVTSVSQLNASGFAFINTSTAPSTTEMSVFHWTADAEL